MTGGGERGVALSTGGQTGVALQASPLLAVTRICTTVCSMGIVPTKRRHLRIFRLILGASVFWWGLCLAVMPAAGQDISGAASPPAEFTRLAEKLNADRTAGAAETQATEEQALEILDRVALASLDVMAPDPEVLNTHLAAFVTRQPPLGEGFRVFRLGGSPASFALLADFGEAGPSAVRIYAGAPGKLSLAARVDRYAQKDFLDDYIELVPVPGPVALFVTVAGRTDDFKTGVFTAWHFDGHQVEPVWMSDILSESNYEVNASGLRLNYCADLEPDDPTVCQQTRHDRFIWQDGVWKQAESATLGPAGAAR
jgi:hypothetical protein